MGSKSSGRWLEEHFSDAYVKKAQLEGYRSRAVYKLQEIEERDHLFRPGMTVIDLGAAPGGWSQWVVRRIQPKGCLIALDLLPMEPIDNVLFIQGDFSDEIILQGLMSHLSTAKADWVLSDMAPNISGNESIDIPRALYLAELALDFALKVLNPTGGILLKVFQGEGFEHFLGEVKKHFKKVAIRKPKASRGRSREVYILGRNRYD